MRKIGKSGQGMPISTLVVIVLAVLVLVMVAFGFGVGWSNLWNQLRGVVTNVNVDSLKQACEVACTTNQKYSFCCLNRTIVYPVGEQKKTDYGNCFEGPYITTQCPSIDCSDKATYCVQTPVAGGTTPAGEPER